MLNYTDFLARTVNYIADEKGYRIKTEEPVEEVVKISETNSQQQSAPVVPASDPVVQAKPTKAETAAVSAVETEPAKVEPASLPEPVADIAETIKLETPAEPVIEAQPVVQAADPVPAIAAVVEEPIAIPAVSTPAVIESAAVAVAESKSDENAPGDDILDGSVLPYIALQPIIVHPGAYFRSGGGQIPYVKPTFRFSPFGYSHGYNYGYPFTAGNFVYAL